MRILFIFFCTIIIQLKAFADTTRVLPFNEFIEKVKNHHPIALQAELQPQLGKAILLEARGAFDPKITANLDQKNFNGSEYYDLLEGKLEIPTWFGVEVEGGYERNQGVFLNPENNVPNAGLIHAGISIPLGQGLFIDKRRTELRKAQLMLNQTASEREIQLNELLLIAGESYWSWYNSYYDLQVYQEAFTLAEQRYNAVKLGAELGERASIDTLEAGIQYQNRQLRMQEALLDFSNNGLKLSVFLWENGTIPLQLSDSIFPESLNENQLLEFSNIRSELDSMLKNHPILRNTQAKIDQMEVDRKWNSEQLKPTLDLLYKPITEPITNNPLTEYSVNNYTWGVRFNFPILLRKERGKLNQIDIKLTESRLKLNNKRQELLFKVQASLNEYETSLQQIKLYQKTAQDYEDLLNGERQLFNGGESSLFMVNSRELGFINAQITLNKLITRNRKAILKTQYALGQLN